MREIKFRAWSIDGRKWCSRVDYDGRKKEWTGVVTVTSPEEKGKYIGEYVAEPEEIIIEQYTGLKDKNGKEIYEGDIIQEEIDFNSKMTDGTFRYRVYWDEEELCWCLEHIGNESIHHELWQCNQSTEVIGNIHENPELIGRSI